MDTAEEEKRERIRILNRAACARYRERHPEKVRAKNLRNKERNLNRLAVWRKNNPDKARAAKNAASRRATATASEDQKDKRREIGRRYRERHPEKMRAQNAEFRKNNPEYMAQWAAATRERRLEVAAKWREKNRNRWREYSHNRRRRLGSGKISLGRIDWLMERQKGRCGVCKVSLKSVGFHLDHIIPVARGGPNEDRNTQLLCPPCNLKKSDKDPVRFMQERGFLL